MKSLSQRLSNETNQNLFKHHFQKNTQLVNIFLNNLTGFLVKSLQM